MTNPGDASRMAPWRGMLLYLVLGAAWVYLGDVLLAHWVSDPVWFTQLQTWKGWAYVLLTSVVAWCLLRDLRRTEKVRLTMAKELAQIVRHAPAGFARLASDGQFLWANERLCELLGVPLIQVSTLNFRDVMVASDRDLAVSQMARLLSGEIDHYVGERECLRPGDGGQVPVLCTVTLVPESHDEPAHLVCVVQDLAELKSARAELKNSETRQRLAAAVVDNTLEGVVVTDAQSRILSANAAVTRLLGYTEEELLGQTPRVFKSGRHDKAFYDAMWGTLRQTGHWQGEIWNRRKNGEVFPEHMSLSAVRDPAGQITHYVCMFTDISEEKVQQQRLEFLAHNDALTGLSNRAWFGHQLEQAVQSARVSGEHIAVLLLNLDRFKDVNDSYTAMPRVMRCSSTSHGRCSRPCGRAT